MHPYRMSAWQIFLSRWKAYAGVVWRQDLLIIREYQLLETIEFSDDAFSCKVAAATGCVEAGEPVK